MDETIYVILKVQFDFVLEVWFSIHVVNKLKQMKSTFIMLKAGNLRILVHDTSWFESCVDPD